eukprot:jgi/Chlat1/5727/Chrsp38S05559
MIHHRHAFLTPAGNMIVQYACAILLASVLPQRVSCSNARDSVWTNNYDNTVERIQAQMNAGNLQEVTHSSIASGGTLLQAQDIVQANQIWRRKIVSPSGDKEEEDQFSSRDCLPLVVQSRQRKSALLQRQHLRVSYCFKICVDFPQCLHTTPLYRDQTSGQYVTAVHCNTQVYDGQNGPAIRLQVRTGDLNAPAPVCRNLVDNNLIASVATPILATTTTQDGTTQEQYSLSVPTELLSSSALPMFYTPDIFTHRRNLPMAVQQQTDANARVTAHLTATNLLNATAATQNDRSLSWGVNAASALVDNLWLTAAPSDGSRTWSASAVFVHGTSSANPTQVDSQNFYPTAPNELNELNGGCSFILPTLASYASCLQQLHSFNLPSNIDTSRCVQDPIAHYVNFSNICYRGIQGMDPSGTICDKYIFWINQPDTACYESSYMYLMRAGSNPRALGTTSATYASAAELVQSAQGEPDSISLDEMKQDIQFVRLYDMSYAIWPYSNGWTDQEVDAIINSSIQVQQSTLEGYFQTEATNSNVFQSIALIILAVLGVVMSDPDVIVRYSKWFTAKVLKQTDLKGRRAQWVAGLMQFCVAGAVLAGPIAALVLAAAQGDGNVKELILSADSATPLYLQNRAPGGYGLITTVRVAQFTEAVDWQIGLVITFTVLAAFPSCIRAFRAAGPNAHDWFSV